MLVTTKLRMPPLRAMMVERPRLLQKLSTGRASRLALIAGQAGSGKTSLVSQWINKTGVNAVWYSLDRSDNEDDLFFRYLFTGFAQEQVAFDDALRPFLQGRRRLTVEETFPLFIEQLVRFGKDIYIVLDDYHLVASTEVHDAVLYLLHYMPPHAHLVLITRVEPPFSLAAMRLRDQLVEISGSDLSFTEEEGAAFLARTMSLKLTEDQVREYMTYSEGWVGGLQLIGLGLRETGASWEHKAIPRAAYSATADYLISEIIGQQQEPIVSFLHTTVFLNRFNGEACRAITGLNESREVLDYLLRINLFLVPLDADRTWYRYHHLFSESVRRRLEREQPSAVATIHRKAAVWFAEHDYLEDAFQHAFAANDYEFAATMLEDHLCKFFDRYSPASVPRWLAKLPRNVFMRHPQLRLDECSFKVLSEQLGDVARALDEIDQEEVTGYQGFKEIRFHNNYTYLKYALPSYSDPTTVDTERLKTGMIELTRDDGVFGLTLDSTLAICYMRRGDVRSADEVLEQSRSEVFSSKSAFRRMLWLRTTAELERWRGRLDRSRAVVKEASTLVDREKLGDTPLKYFVCLPSAWIDYTRNDLDKALEQASTGLRYAEQAMYSAESLDACFLLSLIHIAKKEPQNVKPYLEKMRSIASRSAAHTARLAETHLAYISVLIGDTTVAEAWAARRKLTMDERFSTTFAYECFVLATLRFLCQKYTRSLVILKSVRKKCRERGLTHLVLQIEILLSATLHALDDQGQGKTVMERCLLLAEQEGYIRPFVDCKSLIAPALLDYARSVTPFARSSHLFTVLGACGYSGDLIDKSGKIDFNSCSALTRRETEILKLIAAGFKTGEIARKVFVSLDTVKTHTKHIFEKLEVRTKAEAVAKARRSGLTE